MIETKIIQEYQITTGNENWIIISYLCKLNQIENKSFLEYTLAINSDYAC